MWDTRRLTILYASTACYGDRFILNLTFNLHKNKLLKCEHLSYRVLVSFLKYRHEGGYILFGRGPSICFLFLKACNNSKHHSLNILFILTANGFLPDGNDNTLRHNTQIAHITHNLLLIHSVGLTFLFDFSSNV
jgi:hypothetical protein